jgi:general secretion pathway protein F
LLTSATEERAAKEREKRDIKLFSFFSSAQHRRRRGDDAPARHAAARRHPAVRVAQRAVEQVEKPMLKRALTNIREQVREGTSFAKALESHPKIFRPLYVNMVRAGEASGTLESVLER